MVTFAAVGEHQAGKSTVMGRLMYVCADKDKEEILTKKQFEAIKSDKKEEKTPPDPYEKFLKKEIPSIEPKKLINYAKIFDSRKEELIAN